MNHVLSDRDPVLWWLSPGEGWDTVTRCGWNKLKNRVQLRKSRRRRQVYGLSGVCLMIVCVLSDLT